MTVQSVASRNDDATSELALSKTRQILSQSQCTAGDLETAFQLLRKVTPNTSPKTVQNVNGQMLPRFWFNLMLKFLSSNMSARGLECADTLLTLLNQEIPPSQPSTVVDPAQVESASADLRKLYGWAVCLKARFLSFTNAGHATVVEFLKHSTLTWLLHWQTRDPKLTGELLSQCAQALQHCTEKEDGKGIFSVARQVFPAFRQLIECRSSSLSRVAQTWAYVLLERSCKELQNLCAAVAQRVHGEELATNQPVGVKRVADELCGLKPTPVSLQELARLMAMGLRLVHFALASRLTLSDSIVQLLQQQTLGICQWIGWTSLQVAALRALCTHFRLVIQTTTTTAATTPTSDSLQLQYYHLLTRTHELVRLVVHLGYPKTAARLIRECPALLLAMQKCQSAASSALLPSPNNVVRDPVFLAQWDGEITSAFVDSELGQGETAQLAIHRAFVEIEKYATKIPDPNYHPFVRLRLRCLFYLSLITFKHGSVDSALSFGEDALVFTPFHLEEQGSSAPSTIAASESTRPSADPSVEKSNTKTQIRPDRMEEDEESQSESIRSCPSIHQPPKPLSALCSSSASTPASPKNVVSWMNPASAYSFHPGTFGEYAEVMDVLLHVVAMHLLRGCPVHATFYIQQAQRLGLYGVEKRKPWILPGPLLIQTQLRTARAFSLQHKFEEALEALRLAEQLALSLPCEDQVRIDELYERCSHPEICAEMADVLSRKGLNTDAMELYQTALRHSRTAGTAESFWKKQMSFGHLILESNEKSNLTPEEVDGDLLAADGFLDFESESERFASTQAFCQLQAAEASTMARLMPGHRQSESQKALHDALQNLDDSSLDKSRALFTFAIASSQTTASPSSSSSSDSKSGPCPMELLRRAFQLQRHRWSIPETAAICGALASASFASCSQTSISTRSISLAQGEMDAAFYLNRAFGNTLRHQMLTSQLNGVKRGIGLAHWTPPIRPVNDAQALQRAMRILQTSEQASEDDQKTHSPEQLQHSVTEELPDEMAVCTLGLSDDCSSLLCCRLEKGHCPRVMMALPLLTGKAQNILLCAIESVENILTQNHNLCDEKNIQRGCDAAQMRKQKQQWLAKRRDFDAQMGRVLRNLQTNLLGPWKGLLLGSVADLKLRTNIDSAILPLAEIIKKSLGVATADQSCSILEMLHILVLGLLQDLVHSQSSLFDDDDDDDADPVEKAGIATADNDMANDGAEEGEGTDEPQPSSSEENDEEDEDEQGFLLARPDDTFLDGIAQLYRMLQKDQPINSRKTKSKPCGTPASVEKAAVALVGKLRKMIAPLKLTIECWQHVVFILDKECQRLPWESCPALSHRSISRVPSLYYISHQLSKLSSSAPASLLRDGIRRDRSFYLINPHGDLLKTQTRFEPWFRSENGWTGICGRAPTGVELEQGLQTNDLFLYMGHGSCQEYLNQARVRTLSKCGAALMMGCSSGKLKIEGDLDPHGASLNLLLAGSPSVVSLLWDVTDKDIDGFTTRLLRGFLDQQQQNEEHMPTKSWCQLIPAARADCTFRYLTGAAVVCYGLPVYLATQS